MSVVKPKQSNYSDQPQQLNRHDNTCVNHSELATNTCNCHQARGNACEQVLDGFISQGRMKGDSEYLIHAPFPMKIM